MTPRDQLAACNMEVLVALCDLEKCYDSIPFKLIRSQLNLGGYPKELTAQILLHHGAPMLI